MNRNPDLLQGPIRSVLWQMTVPMMFGIVSIMLFNLADIWFVGQLGTLPMAALAFTFPVSFAVVSLAIGLGIGTSATLAKRIGEGNGDSAKQLASSILLMTFMLLIVVGVAGQWAITPIFTLLGADQALMPYITAYMQIWFAGSVFMVMNMVCNSILRATGDVRGSAMIMLLASLLNLILDPLLIFGLGPFPALGIQGAAIASVIAWSTTTLVALRLIHYRRQLLTYRLPSFLKLLSYWRELLVISLPAALSNITTPVANGVLTAIVARHGAEAVAAFGVGNRIESLALLVCLALSMSLPPFISQNLGAGQMERIKKAYAMVIRFAIAWQLLIYLLLLAVSSQVAGFFSDDPEVIRWIQIWIMIVPLGFAFQATTFLSASSFNALHQPLLALNVSIIRLFVLYLPLGWLGNHLFGLHGLFTALVIANVLTAMIAWVWMRRNLVKLMHS